MFISIDLKIYKNEKHDDEKLKFVEKSKRKNIFFYSGNFSRILRNFNFLKIKNFNQENLKNNLEISKIEIKI